MTEELVGSGILLSVAHGQAFPEEQARADGATMSPSILLENKYLHIGGRRGIWQKNLAGEASHHDLVILPHENRLLTNYAILGRRKAGNYRVAFWGHAGNLQGRRERGVGEIVRRWSARRANWWFAYTALSVRNLLAWGIPPERITCVNNAVDTAAIAQMARALPESELRRTRQELGLEGDRCAVCLGGLVPEKKLDFLSVAADRIRAAEPRFELILIGDGPLREQVRAFAAGRPWVRWVGAKYGAEMVRHAALGCVALNPGMVGLGILDCFALGLPLVTTDCGIHSPEIEYLEAGRNGIVTPFVLQDYVAAVVGLLREEDRRVELAAGCRESAGRYTLEAMVRNFCAGIQQALEASGKIPGPDAGR